MSRIRQIKPSWFLDKELRRGLSADAREFYIGLWILADDAGYLAWDPERIGAELYPFDDSDAREAQVEDWAGQLERLNAADPHLVVWTCGHARVPKMPDHQRVTGTRALTVDKRHREHCRDVRSRLSLRVARPDDAGTGPEPDVATRSPGIGRGRERTEREEREGTPAAARDDAPADVTEFRARVPRPGAADPAQVCSCGKPKVQAAAGRWVCTNAPGHSRSSAAALDRPRGGGSPDLRRRRGRGRGVRGGEPLTD